MSIRQEMLEAARRGAAACEDGGHGAADFVLARQEPGGGFRGRGGGSDLYYTSFALQVLWACGRPVPPDTLAYLESFGEGPSLDLVHLCCLARSWACAGAKLAAPRREAMRQRIETFRAGAGYSVLNHAAGPSAYGTFVAMSGLQDLGLPVPEAGQAEQFIRRLQAPCGGFGNEEGASAALTPGTAAAVCVLRQLGAGGDDPVVSSAAAYLAARQCEGGGFAVMEGMSMGDLLSTATALHALASVEAIGPETLKPCLEFVRQRRTADGGFCGSEWDSVADCEYAFYGLLAMGHLCPA